MAPRYCGCTPPGSPKQIKAATGLVPTSGETVAMPTRMGLVLRGSRQSYERIVAELHAGVVDGSALLPGPTWLGPAAHRQGTYGVATGTAQRAITLLSRWV
ncbi:MAG: hypothetical protein ACRDTT_07380 [Pseudonocardiaceae bacterium]